MGAIGAAVGSQRFEIAITLSVVIYLILRWIRPAVAGEDRHGREPEEESAPDEGG